MMELTLEDGTMQPIRASEEVRPLLETLNGEDNTFAILAKADEDYIQTSRDGGGFVVETRRGSASEHFAAARAGSSPASGSAEPFDLEETIGLFTAWIEGRDSPSIEWVRVDI